MPDRPTKTEAILSLRPTAGFSYDDVTGAISGFIDSTGAKVPTDTEIETELAKLQTEYDNNKYQRDRQPLYPSYADFADAMYWNSKGDSTKLEAYYAACEKVKTDNPKPS